MNWGFMGYGRIAKKFEESLSHTEHKIIAIASRSGYADVKPNIVAYKSYEDLVSNPDVQIVYVNTTHNNHEYMSIMALEAGKHVLCEKPLSTSESSVRRIIAAAKKNNRYLMEAVWSRYLPGYVKAMSLISSGAIGEVESISVHFGFRMNPEDPKERLIDPALAAGAIWDVGIYPISLIQDIFKEDPITMDVVARLSPLGVETRCAAQLTFSNHRVAQLSCAIDLTTPNYALISGSKGNIVMEDFWKCEKLTVNTPVGTETFSLPMKSTGLYHEALACAEHIQSNLLESPSMTWENSLQLSKIMDKMILLSRSE